MKIENHSWYAVITAEVLLNKELTDKQKLLIVLISNLQKGDRCCFASNAYLAECLGCSEVTIRNNISVLVKMGYLDRVVKVNEKNEVEYRSLSVIEPRSKSSEPLRSDEEDLRSKSSDPTLENERTAAQNRAHNNIVIITKNNKEIDKSISKEEMPFESDKFIETWQEYLSMRRKIRKPATEKAKELALGQLAKLSKNNEALAIRILEQSILNSWQGLFELRDKPGDEPASERKMVY